MNLAWGKFNTVTSNHEGLTIDLSSRMPKAQVVTELNSEQLVSGHLRIDMLRPMTKGNLVLLKGERNTGKTSLAVSVIKNFLAEPNTKAVYVGMSKHG